VVEVVDDEDVVVNDVDVVAGDDVDVRAGGSDVVEGSELPVQATRTTIGISNARRISGQVICRPGLPTGPGPGSRGTEPRGTFRLMATVRRLTDSCLLVTTDTAATLIDPGFHTFESGEIDLDSIGVVTRICITHEHKDHVSPPFVTWVLDRGSDVVVYSNEAVAKLLEPHGIEVEEILPDGLRGEDVLHEALPNGARPPNRSFTVEGLLTHPGDSHQPASTAPILALPLIAPWGSVTSAVEFAKVVGPRQVIPIHDFYLNGPGREFAARIARSGLEGTDIEVLELGWGDSITV